MAKYLILLSIAVFSITALSVSITITGGEIVAGPTKAKETTPLEPISDKPVRSILSVNVLNGSGFALYATAQVKVADKEYRQLIIQGRIEKHETRTIGTLHDDAESKFKLTLSQVLLVLSGGLTHEIQCTLFNPEAVAQRTVDIYLKVNPQEVFPTCQIYYDLLY